MEKIYLGSDHGGFKLKNELVKFLEEKGCKVIDMGPFELNPKDDYPDYAIPPAEKVAQNPQSAGILLCRNGQGVCIAANKVKGIRAVTGFSMNMIKSTRADDNANVLCLPADYISLNEAKEIVKIFLKTPFSEAPRHVRRLNKIKKFEKTKKFEKKLEMCRK